MMRAQRGCDLLRPEERVVPFLSDFYQQKQALVAAGEWQFRSPGRPASGPRHAGAAWGRFHPGQFSVLAEIKRASPSRGAIADHAVSGWARGLEAGGAGALSVLTEPKHFHGDLDVLAEVAAVAQVPLLRKDFLLDVRELDEALAFGASAVLLILAFVPPALLSELYREARARALSVLIEVHDAREVDAALSLDDCRGDGCLLGINQRNLETLQVAPRYAETLAPRLPSGTRFIVESGVSGPDDLRFARGLGASGVLVGEALARSADPGATLQRWLSEA